MEQNIYLRTRFAERFIPPINLTENIQKSIEAYLTLVSGTGAGNEFLGWMDLPERTSNKEIERIELSAERIRSQSEYLVVVGIGGSYLGARAVLEAIQGHFSRYTTGTKVLYAGHHLDPVYHDELLEFLKDKNFSVNVISKSGTTTEPAIAFRLLLDLLESKYSKDELRHRVIATTDSKKGALKKLADSYGFETFVIPDDVGGRFSVLTPVGLLPIAVGTGNIRSLISGARDIRKILLDKKETLANPVKNPSLLYSCYRNSLYLMGRKVEIFVSYNPGFHYFSEWWKQLFGESEGKNHKGIFPASVDFTTDLHSLGQYIQDGERILFETVLYFSSCKRDIELKEKSEDLDGLNYLTGKKLSWISEKATLGTLVAHTEGGVPCIEVLVPGVSEYYLGQLIYFFEFACGISAYTLGVNPFDQPGVEDYKNNMFALLGKKGYEERKADIEKLIG